MAHEKPSDHTEPTGTTNNTGATGPEGAAYNEGGTHPGNVDHGVGAETAPPPGPRPGGVFSAETFGLTALLLLAVTLLSGQLLEIFTSVLLVGGQPVPVEQVAQINLQLLVGGVLAVIAALTAVLSLVLADAGTHPWARWVGTAALIVSLLLALVAMASYILVPAGVEQQMPTFPE